jgi:4-amino-4-deoxy-L-arabinose transferase-like glycosyltransferase
MDTESPNNKLADPLVPQAVRAVAPWHVLVLTGTALLLFLLSAHSLPLADPEEARCGLIVRDVLEHGHWLVPHLQGKPYFDKPAPFFWLAAAGVSLTGSAELGGRLIPALAGLLAVLVTYDFARRVFRSGSAGLLAGLVLATSGEFLFMARWYRMDMPLAAAMWAAIWWFWRSEDRRLRGELYSKIKTWLGFYLFAGLATLFKGPAGLGLPGLALLSYFLLSRQYRRIAEMLSPPGIAAYLLVAAPWYVAVSLAEPGYASEFFLRQNIERFTGAVDLGHSWPGILYVPIILAGMAPWTIFLPGIALRYFPRRWKSRNDRPALSFLWICALVWLVFFSFSGTKLASYVLPVFPPLAVMVGGLLTSWIASSQPDRLMDRGARAITVTVLFLPAVPLTMELWLRTDSAWLAVPFGIAASGFVAMLYAIKGRHRGRFVGVVAAVMAGSFVYLILRVAPAGYKLMSTRDLVRSVDASALRAGRFGFCPNSKPSLLLYAGMEDAPTIHVAGNGNPDSLVEWLRSYRPVWCLVSGEKHLSQLRQGCPGGFRIAAAEGDCWLITNDKTPRAAAISSGIPTSASTAPASARKRGQ